MATTDHKIKIQFVNCDADANYRSKIDELVSSMEKSEAPYRGSVNLEISKKDGRVSVDTNDSNGLTDEHRQIYQSIVDMATKSSANGKEPNKVKTEISVEKEL